MKRVFHIPWVTALILSLAPVSSVNAAGVPVHYLVLEIDRVGSIRPLFHQLVEVAAAPRSLSIEELALATAGADGEVIGFETRSRSGEPLFRNAVRLDSRLRGEFHGEPRADGAWEIESHRVPLQRPVAFVIRVPVSSASLLVFNGVMSNVFDLIALAESASSLPLAGLEASAPEVESLGPPPGDPANRVDLLVMGDGYTAGDAAKFATDSTNVINTFFSVNAYMEYRNYVNVTTLFTASTESGADHPPYNAACPPPADNPACCKDIAASTDPLAGTYKNTAFDGRYCAFNVHRLAVVSNAKVFAAAAAVPDWDHILMLLNDTTYGGSGGAIATASIHPAAVDVARHEYGHSFTGLADEYTTPFPGFPACSDLPGSISPCEANVTDETARALIKWEPWILPATPIPTLPPSPAVGLFEGARYMTTGMYRPRNTCLMKVLGVPFGEICTQSYVLKLYQGSFGIPATGIDPIEPGSESPPPGNVTMTAATQQFGVDVLSPVGGPAAQITWKVNGGTTATATDTFVFAPPGPGTHVVRVEVQDVTPLVNSIMAGTSLQSSRDWSVDTCGPDGHEPDSNEGQAKTVTSGVPKSHTICPANDHDWSVFTLGQPSGVALETTGGPFPEDTRMWLRSPGGAEIEFNDDINIGLDRHSRIDRLCDVDALAAGTYYVQVDEHLNNHEIPAYALNFTATACASCQTSILLENTMVTGTQVFNASLTATLGPNLDVDGTDIVVQGDQGVIFLDNASFAGTFRVGNSSGCP